MKKRLLLAVLLPIVMVAILASCGKKENGHEYVDLGLSVKWATCNVGADSPTEYGDYFAWGEVEPKAEYTATTYKYDSNPEVLPLSNDAAHVNWGGKWRMPTEAEQDELRNNCKWEWTTRRGVEGYKVTSNINGNSIFLPAAGYRSFSNLRSEGSLGLYWSSSSNMNSCYHACCVSFYSCDEDWDAGSGRSRGHSVRAVCEQCASKINRARLISVVNFQLYGAAHLGYQNSNNTQ